MRYISECYFGMADGANDVADDPARFLRTYLDRWDLPSEIHKHRKALLLGPKGAGKTAAAYHVTLTWKAQLGEHAVFSSVVDFDELNRTQSPLSSLSGKLVSEDVTAITDTAWRLFIGVKMLDSLVDDPACSLSYDRKVASFVEDLKRAGLASDDYPQVLRKVRERIASISVPSIANAGYTSKDADTSSPAQLADAVINLLLRAESTNRHLLAIDGLDKIAVDSRPYWSTIAALVRVTDQIRRRLQECRNECVYVILMCRSDVFRKIGFPDAAKLAADSGVYIEWGAEENDPLSVPLWDYISKKAEVSTLGLLDLLPREITVGSSQSIAIAKYILQFSRYTPRDMSLIFNAIKRETMSGTRPTAGQVRHAIDRFSSENFLLEVISEAVGLLPPRVVNQLESVLYGLSRRFTKDDLTKAIEAAGISDEISSSALGEYLFLQGAIGSHRPDSGYVSFYHRRNTAKFNKNGPWLLHAALAYGLNLEW